MSLAVILQIVAFVLFVLSAIGISVGKINLTAAGLALWVLSSFIGQFVPPA